MSLEMIVVSEHPWLAQYVIASARPSVAGGDGKRITSLSPDYQANLDNLWLHTWSQTYTQAILIREE